MDADLNNGVLFLDLKKAFDTLNHKRVLKGGWGVQSHFPPEILAKSQSQLDFYLKSQSELLKSQSIKNLFICRINSFKTF
jgi:hypothetical protein